RPRQVPVIAQVLAPQAPEDEDGQRPEEDGRQQPLTARLAAGDQRREEDAGGEGSRRQESSGPGELHPQALSGPGGRVAPHPALMIRSTVEFRSARGPAGSDLVAPPSLANGQRWWSDASTVCISSAPI